MPVEALILGAVLATVVAVSAPEAPTPEMLEWLVRFETTDGQWLDPLTLDDEPAEVPRPRPEEKQP